MASQEEVIVVVTGFGPFSQYLVNLSWQAAQPMMAVSSANLMIGLQLWVSRVYSRGLSDSGEEVTCQEIQDPAARGGTDAQILELPDKPEQHNDIKDGVNDKHSNKQSSVHRECYRFASGPIWTGLETLGLGDDVIVYAKELPVHYSKAQELIAHIWKTIKPKLAVHMGIAPGSKTVTLEQCGKNQGYKQRDVCGACPPGHCCVEGGQDILHSIIDMKTLSRHLQSLGLDVIYSRDAGRFLCDFVYYYSLHLAGGKSVFLHLPTRGALADLDKLLPLLQAVILAMLGQLEAQ